MRCGIRAAVCLLVVGCDSGEPLVPDVGDADAVLVPDGVLPDVPDEAGPDGDGDGPGDDADPDGPPDPPVCGDGRCTRTSESCAACPADCSCWAPPHLVRPFGIWKYLDDGSDRGTAWTAVDFDDSDWAAGPAELGYGEGDEATVVSYGPDASRKYTTTYFRASFELLDPTTYAGLRLRLLRDDGAVAYLNGHEVLRSNMPDGPIDVATEASAGADCEDCWYEASVSAGLLTAGVNVVAVEVHQVGPTSSDVSFNLELTGRAVGEPVCGDEACEPGESCGGCPGDCGTCPVAWSFFAIGDTRSNDDIFQSNVVSMLDYDPTAVACLNGGDIVLGGGADVWNVHQHVLADGAPDPTVPPDPTGIPRQSRFRTDAVEFGDYIRYFGVIGNHDVEVADWHDNWNRYLPGQAALGVNSPDGVYFSFAYSNALFVVLDSEHPSAAQTAWLADRLTDVHARGAFWKFVFFHYPVYPCNEKSPFARGLPWVTLFEEYGVDIAFVNHSHTYERTCPMLGGRCAEGGVIYLNSSGGGAGTRVVLPTKADTVSYGGRTDSYDCAEVLVRGRGEWHQFCHLEVDGCRLTLRCLGHEYWITGEAPFDVFELDRC
ncbi:MAG: metallophosphoesterase [Deltaproteobacteria bacterium]|nr:metallophosphoesterase [Deltaproteobacteria bacterium]